MSEDLFKPKIETTPFSDQRVLCGLVQNTGDVEDGGCNGILCTGCILDGNQLTAFHEWINEGITQSSQPKQQFDLF